MTGEEERFVSVHKVVIRSIPCRWLLKSFCRGRRKRRSFSRDAVSLVFNARGICFVFTQICAGRMARRGPPVPRNPQRLTLVLRKLLGFPAVAKGRGASIVRLLAQRALSLVLCVHVHVHVCTRADVAMHGHARRRANSLNLHAAARLQRGVCYFVSRQAMMNSFGSSRNGGLLR